MAADGFFESEVALTAAATAALFSPRVRNVLRQGVVYGVAGVLTAGRTAVSVASGAGRGLGGVIPGGVIPSSSNRRSSVPASSRATASERAASPRPRSTAASRSPASGGGSRSRAGTRRAPAKATSRSSTGSDSPSTTASA